MGDRYFGLELLSGLSPDPDPCFHSHLGKLARLIESDWKKNVGKKQARSKISPPIIRANTQGRQDKSLGIDH